MLLMSLTDTFARKIDAMRFSRRMTLEERISHELTCRLSHQSAQSILALKSGARAHHHVSTLIVDIIGFKSLVSSMHGEEVFNLLNNLLELTVRTL